MIKRQEASRKSNVVDFFSKKAEKNETSNVDYSLLEQLNVSKRRLGKSVKHIHRDNLLVLFPSFCA